MKKHKSWANYKFFWEKVERSSVLSWIYFNLISHVRPIEENITRGTKTHINNINNINNINIRRKKVTFNIMCNSCNVLNSTHEKKLFNSVWNPALQVDPCCLWLVSSTGGASWLVPTTPCPHPFTGDIGTPRVVKFTRVHSITKSPLFDNHFVSPTCTELVLGHMSSNVVWNIHRGTTQTI